LSDAGIDVLLLEAGGFKHDAKAQSLYRGTVLDPSLHNPLEAHRARRFGGTTNIWGGRLVPFDPIDFERRDWIAASGWPIGIEDIAPFYPQANELCDGGQFEYSVAGSFPVSGREMIRGFQGEYFSADTIERFSMPTNFGRRYREPLAAAANLRVLLHANVMEIQLDEAGKTVVSLDIRTDQGKRLQVVAKKFVLGAGGLETVRLMLASNGVHKNGVGNDHDGVGRYYMAHLAGTIGTFAPAPGTGAVWNEYEIADHEVYCRRRLALRPEAQRKSRSGNFIARLHHTRISDPSHGSGVLSSFRLGRFAIPERFRTRLQEDVSSWTDLAHHTVNVLRDLPAIVGFAGHMLTKRLLAARKYPSVVIRPRSNRYSLDFHAEQEPNRVSQVRLSVTERDEFGMPRLEVDWRYTQQDVATITNSLALFAEDVARSGCGTYRFQPDEVENEIRRYGAYGGHHLGTTRMGSDPLTSVVDANCRVHGLNNLYIAGGSVFATSSQANPTLTAVALALRLGNHLLTRLERVPNAAGSKVGAL
jgi:choline dehydrogenase-like flavoprotein